MEAVWLDDLNQTYTRSVASNLLQIALDDEMFDVGPSNHKSLTLLKVYAPQLSLNHSTISNNANEDMQVFRRICDAGGDI